MEPKMSAAVSDRGTGGATFAAVTMIIAGTMGLFEGLSLLAKETYYVQPSGYWMNTRASTWGWVHILVSIVVLAAGFGVISGATWDRWTGITIVGFQTVVNFLFIPA
jgi:hypothetical protein